jgi:uncharacterized protein (DUF1684 family)
MKNMIATVLCAFAAISSPGGNLLKSYAEEMRAFHAGEEQSLIGPNGWLYVAGLYWLHPGANTVGSDPSCSVSISGHGLPAQLGSITILKDKALFTAAQGAKVLKDGKPFDFGDVNFDQDKLVVGDVNLTVIKRGERIGIRLYDPNSNAKKQYKGMSWFPVNPNYKVTAKFVPYPKGKTMPIVNVLGDTRMAKAAGYAEFTLNGVPCRLEAEDEGDIVFFNFRDATTGKSTYPAGRFLNAPKPVDGKVEIDFNKATNPPCAWTPYATCPLPPKGNTLTVKVEAGEKTHHPVG